VAGITVTETKSGGGGFEYEVVVEEGGSRTSHKVRLGREYELVRKSFEFLLENEPKESILGSFDLSVIERYFPEYQGVIKKRF
jgi:hypothetical protein